ncbi:trypsin-like [Chironomus tepperi]|uniref:trypsin-like n=1 Tax=Chironomus tepperi TaxID=113505 RepID=UPI00391F947F
MQLKNLRNIFTIIILQISFHNVYSQLPPGVTLPPGITLPPWITLPPEINLPDGKLPDNYMLVHQALITHKGNTNLNEHLCGGVLVLNFTVVTSANCLLKDNDEFYNASELSVALGTYSIENILPSQPSTYEVKEVIVHGRFNRRTLANSIAVIKLIGNVNAGERILPTMPSRDKVSTSMECYLLHHSNNEPSIIKINPKYNSRCSTQTQQSWPPETFCSGSDDQDFDTCEANQGSALICDGMLQGIVTRSCSSDVIMQYADASQFFYWIAIKQLDVNPYRLMDNEMVRYYLFGSLDFIAWLSGSTKVADAFELVKFFF